LVATLALPLLFSSALPEPTSAVHAFLVDPLIVPPPPPPPPSPSARSAVARAKLEVVPAQPAGFIAPVEVPSELIPEAGLDLGIEGGVAGGVEGGVPGGVVGAIVGGLPDSLAKPPPPRALRVSGLVKEPVKIKHVAPVYPPVAEAGKIEGSVSLEALVDQRGRVQEVVVLEGHPLFEEAAVEAVRQWLYTPTLLDGVPVSLILMVTVHFRLAD
jgi:protein TonB